MIKKLLCLLLSLVITLMLVACGDDEITTSENPSSSKLAETMPSLDANEISSTSTHEMVSEEAPISSLHSESEDKSSVKDSLSSKTDVSSKVISSSNGSSMDVSSVTSDVEKPKVSVTSEEFDEERAKHDSLYYNTMSWEIRCIINENARVKYMKNNNIDAATVGKTGEFCGWCGKEIWDEQAISSWLMIDECPVYVSIPGDPIGGYGDDCQYCRGLCGLTIG